MLQFVQPIWLTLMAGIIVPVIIHLWQRRPSKVLQVGSTLLLRESSLKHARSLRLSEWLLLLVRCALIIVLAILLAQPVLKKPMTAAGRKGWVMVSSEGAYRHFKPEIDTLLQQGHTLHLFTPSFPEVAVAWLPATEDTAGYWQLLQQLDRQLPAGFSIHLFTANRLEKIKSTRPASALHLSWKVYTPADSVAEQTILQFPMEKDSTKMMVLHSTPSSNTLITRNSAGKTGTPLQVTIYTDKYREDARYLEAALTSVQQYLQRDMQVQTVFTPESAGNADWLFWLSEQTPPAAHKKLLHYATGKPENISTGDIYKLIPAKDSLAADWQDAAGRMVLGHEGDVYTFYTHFHPTYTNMVWEDDFPVKVMQLLMPDTFTVQQDKRAVAISQLLPAKAGKDSKRTVLLEEVSLLRYCWLLLFLLCALERWMAARRKTAIT